MKASPAARSEAEPAAAPRAGRGAALKPPGGVTRAPPIQAKLTIGAVDDPLEREADRVADLVMRMPAAPGAAADALSRAPSTLQRKCAACAEDEKTTVRLKPSGSPPGPAAEATAPASVAAALAGPGQRLDPATRAFFEPRFGRALDDVRVHTGAAAARSATAIGGRAYTARNHIVFATGEFAPGTTAGRSLLAHELAHVVQQSDGRPPSNRVQRKAAAARPPAAEPSPPAPSRPAPGAPLAISAPGDPDEQEAERAAGQALHRMAGGAEPPPRVERSATSTLRRTCAACGGERAAEEEPGAPARLQRFAPGAGGPAAAGLSSQLAAARGGGSRLPASARGPMEHAFGADFSAVRVHTDQRAEQLNRELGAEAFAYGNDLFFASGRFSPATGAGRRLLAHELAHVLQQHPDRLQRQPDEDPLLGVELALINSSPVIFALFLRFQKKPVAFNVAAGGGVSLTFGQHRMKAIGFSEEDEVKERAVLFELPDQSPPYLWIIVPADDAGKIVDLKRARQYMLKHVVTLTVSDAEGEAGPEGKASPAIPPAQKFVAAEDWLDKQLIPAVQALLAGRPAEARPDKLIGYQSLPIQETEGKDVSLIQVEKNDPQGKKRIAGHLRVYKSRWVGQAGDVQKKYAEETANAIVAKVQQAGKAERVAELKESQAKATKGETFPAWAIELLKQVEKKLTEIRQKKPGTKQPELPDMLFMVKLGDEPFFRLYVEQPAENDPQRLVWNSAIMMPRLNEDQLKDVDGLVRIIGEQTQLLRRQAVRTGEDDKPQRTRILMPEIPAEIFPLNLSASGATVTGASNRFRMSVRIDKYFPPDPLQGADIAQALGLNTIDYDWKSVWMTAANASHLVKAPAKPQGPQPGDVFYDLNNRAIDQGTKTAIAHDRVDYPSILANEAYKIVDTDHGEVEIDFPEMLEGVYLIACQTTPRPLDRGEDVRMVFPPSRAVFPVRVLKPANLARETVSEAPNALQEKEQLKDNPKLSESERRSLQVEIDNLKGEEGMSQLDLGRQSQAQIVKKIALFRGLKAWMIEDRKQHPSTLGTADTDPFIVRLLMQDKIRDTRYFGAWQELHRVYGESAYSVKDLELDYTKPEGQANALNQYLALLDSQQEQATRLVGMIEAQEKGFKARTLQRPVATLIAKKTGQATPLLLLFGEAPDSVPGAYKFRILDLTLFAATKLYETKSQIYVGEVSDNRALAMRNAFINYGEDNQYDDGEIIYRFPPDTTLYRVPNVTTLTEYAEKASMILAIVGLIASVAASGGATTPALAAFIAFVSVANAALAGVIAYQHLTKRHERGTLELDADAAMDVINVLASFVAIGGMGKVAQLERAAAAAGSAARAAQIAAQVQRLGKLMLIFDAVTLGATAVITGFKVADDVARIKGLRLPKAQEDALLHEVATNAVMQGAMLAFQTVTMARAHLEAYRTRVEESRYRNLEERGWVDAEGKVTEAAPPFLRAGAKGEPAPTQEKPPVRLEEELPQIKQAAKAGGVVEEPPASEYDLSVTITNKDGESHVYRRRREDRAICRSSGEEFCFFTEEDIKAFAEAIGRLDEPRPGPSGTKPGHEAPVPATAAEGGKATVGQTAGNAVSVTQTLEATVEQARANVAQELGKTWLLPHLYGTKLHKAAADLFRKLTLPQGWRMVVDRALRFAGVIKQRTLDLTVEAFFSKEEHMEHAWLKDKLPKSLLEKRIGDIEPDLVLFAPDGTVIVWDLAPGLTPEHLAKTILYTHALGESGKRFQIGETYYRPQRMIELNGTQQARFRGDAGEAAGAVLGKLSDDEILVLLRRHAGNGEPLPADLPTNPKARALLDKRAAATGQPVAAGDVPRGYHGSAELVTGANKKIVGKYYDADAKAWVDTSNFSIHYTEDGLYIRPEKP